LMLKLLPARDAAHARPPLAFVLVIDTSGSMAGEKLDRAIEASHGLLNDPRLQPHDLVSVIHFNDEAASLLPTEELGDRKKAHAAVDSLRNYSGGTVMGLGLELALAEIRKIPQTAAKRIVLFTDGETTDEEHCRSLSGEFGPMNAPIVAAGIGDEYNESLLRDTAASSLGRPYHLKLPSDFQEVLETELGSSVREVVTDIRLNVGIAKGVAIDSVMRVYPSLSEVSMGEKPFRLGNAAAGDHTVFILESTVSGLSRPASRARLLQVQLTAELPGMNRREELPPKDLFIEFTTDPAAIAAVDAEVMDYVKQKNVDNLVQQAVRQAATNPVQAGKTLQIARNMTLQLKNANVTTMLDSALDELNKTGTISVQTRKTISLGGRTKTVKTGAAGLNSIPPLDQIRKVTGV
jgi:Ca-activated chloride channel family protein